MAVHDLEVLYRVFDIDDSARTVLEIDRVMLHQLLQLLPAQVQGDCEIPRGATVDIGVTMGLDALAKGRIACYMPQFDQGLPLERGGEAGVIVISGDFVKRICQRAFAPMGAEAHVEMEDPFLPGFDPLQQFLSQAFEVFAVIDGLFAAGSACVAVDEQDFDIGGIAQFTAAEFAQSKNREGTGFLIGQTGRAVEFVQFGLAVLQAPVHDHFSQLGERAGKVGQRDTRLDDMLHVDTKQLAILKRV